MTSCVLPLKKEVLLNGVNSLKKEFAPLGANSFLKELTSTEKGGKIENCGVASPESVSSHFNLFLNDQKLNILSFLTSKIKKIIIKFK